MTAVSMSATALQLGKSAGNTVRLSEFRENGYTRTAADKGYVRVNPLQVADGNADDPDRADNKHYLGNWVGYDHDSVDVGTISAVGGYGEVTITLETRPNGYDRAPSLLAIKAYSKGTGYSGSSPGETETSTDPLSSPYTTQQEGYTDPHPTSVTINAPENEWVAVAVTELFDDSSNVHESVLEYSADAGETYPLTGASEGILVECFSSAPSFSSASQTTDPTSCFSGQDVTISLSWDMDGPSTGTLQERKGSGGTWTTVSSNVTAGSSGGTRTVQSGFTWYWRLRYNDVSPNQWSNTVQESAECTQI